jgi:hypothetical protein
MTPVLIASLFDPVFWGIIWFTVWCGYRLPRWSWYRLPVTLLALGSLAGIIVLQAHLWQGLEPQGTNHKVFDQVLFPEIIPGLLLMFGKMILEDRAKKRRDAASPQPAGDASAGAFTGKK